MDMITLLGAGFIAGLINAVAGGGALLVYPLLLSLGLSPIVANASTTITLWPGALSSAYGYRKYIKRIPNYYYWLLVPSAVGGLIGAFVLTKTTNHDFSVIVPWLIVLGVVLIALQPYIHKKLTKKDKKRSKKTSVLNLILVAIPMFAMAIYGGYFGAGYGIVMLALLGFTKLSDIHQMNGLKNLSGATINLLATVYFVHRGLVDWHYIPVLLIGSIIGGYIGSTYSSKLPTKLIRFVIIVIGIAVSIYLFTKY
jgi:uncharacterized membrane protein YfcA